MGYLLILWLLWLLANDRLMAYLALAWSTFDGAAVDATTL